MRTTGKRRLTHVASEGLTHVNAYASARELDHRISDGIDAWLLWDAQSDRISVAVEDHHLGESAAFEVDPADVLSAFQHPYAYVGAPRSPAWSATGQSACVRVWPLTGWPHQNGCPWL